MKPLREGLDLGPKTAYYRDCEDGILLLSSQANCIRPDAYTTPYVEDIIRALEAAIAVIDIYESKMIEIGDQMLGNGIGSKMEELENALMVFRKEGS